MIIPAWLTWARREIGTAEIVGTRHELRVLEYWRIGKVPLDVSDDETPWCAALVCAALEAVGIRSPRTGRARGFDVGKNLENCDHRLGAIVVLSSDRGAASGHVGLLEGVSPGRVHLLGGNQGNRVCIAPFPSARIVSILWPLAAPRAQLYPMAPTLNAAGANVSDG